MSAPILGSQHIDMHGKITVDLGSSGRRNIPVYRDMTKVSFGRGQHNDVVCDDEYVSYEHAAMYWCPWSLHVMIVDLNSTNGTWVHGHRLTPMKPINIGGFFTISFGHALQNQVTGEMDRGPWTADYGLLPEDQLKADWLELACEQLDDPDIRTPTGGMRLQMVLADIKAQRAPPTLDTFADDQDSDSDATVVPDSTTSLGPERPATPVQPVPPPFSPDYGRGLRREPPIHLNFGPHPESRNVRDPNLIWSSNCTYIRPNDDDDGRVPPYVYEWSHKYGLPQGLHPEWNEYAKDKFYGKDVNINLEQRMNEAEEAVRKYELEVAADARPKEEEQTVGEATQTAEAAAVEISDLDCSTKRKRETEVEDGDDDARDNDDEARSKRHKAGTDVPPHPGRFAAAPQSVLRPMRSSHVVEPYIRDDTPSMPGAWVEPATDFLEQYSPFVEDPDWIFVEVPVIPGDEAQPTRSSPPSPRPASSRPNKQLRFAEEVLYAGRVVG
ncbi:unnamed protein product [Peniophora sp. CBMAI 1063]|nr:unnamed protein product [Peniophora sp. CBMAI 1063]